MPDDSLLAPAPAAPLRLLLSPREAAAALCVCEKTLYSLTAPRGPLPVVRIGRAVRYAVADLQEFIAAKAGGTQ